ncbi:MAG TPA: exodeoxyribonuclease V subunit alpha [Accumulibacter sp.]|nr:exodeoxyribonuclease V subunit alpha [Accumulibacter sp.]HNC19167.1 exodeoxyribonuclease V subunit alpha [Accumulibacter sp.]HND80745.1 exodeoxyribonuclease V subunit alpha [Accumulibacter sp.]HNG39173.1 exodeoxyribonuclease V subunit alpha [Accumulibacter sp.]HNL15064.1 exodeoxyribonuclease V subunit alpha [Accumulibacter sp.]
MSERISRETAGNLLADGFAEHLRSWAVNSAAPDDTLPVLAAAGRLASLATQAGHVCASLSELRPLFPGHSLAELSERLLASRQVTTAPAAADGDVRPLLIDGQGRLYLYRYFAYERRLADHLRRRLRAAPTPPDAGVRERLGRLFAKSRAHGDQSVDWQKLAVALAWRNRLTIVSGGPGTGKTRTVALLLACLLDEQPELRIALAAPTGKAAARMLEALRKVADDLPPALQQRLPRESYTLHRLLGATGETERFRHHADHPLPIDTLVVDEASMLDLALACRLFDAIPEPARVILLGDKDQLAAVEAGAVFAELSADPTLSPWCIADLAQLTGTPASAIVPPAPLQNSPLTDCVLWLTESHRFASDSGIGRLAAEINAGNGAAACDWLANAGDPSLTWLDDAASTAGGPLPERVVQAINAAYEGYFVGIVDALARGSAIGPEIFALFDRFRVLCALRDGTRGVVAVNRLLERHLRRRLGESANTDRSPWYPGRPVMVLRNDYLLRVFNGDVGLCLPDDDGELSVCFPEKDGQLRRIAALRLPEHETAFAITVHKSQGSEFASLLLLLPEDGRGNRLLNRELLYTGVTRAAKQVTLVASRQVLIEACAQRSQRHSGLLTRLNE